MHPDEAADALSYTCHSPDQVNKRVFFTDADGTRWYRTGDIGTQDTDGYVFLARVLVSCWWLGSSLSDVNLQLSTIRGWTLEQHDAWLQFGELLFG